MSEDSFETLPVCRKCSCNSCKWVSKAEIDYPECTHGPECINKHIVAHEVRATVTIVERIEHWRIGIWKK